jgi:5-(carboxyamino)imidazole ribonucleotide mutase
VVAANTSKPVINVPVNAALDGLDSLLSTAQMLPDVPVACIGIGRGENAAVIAARIIALQDKLVAKKLDEYKREMRKNVEKGHGEIGG